MSETATKSSNSSNAEPQKDDQNEESHQKAGRMKNIQGKIEILANIAIIVVALLIGFVVVKGQVSGHA